MKDILKRQETRLGVFLLALGLGVTACSGAKNEANPSYSQTAPHTFTYKAERYKQIQTIPSLIEMYGGPAGSSLDGYTVSYENGQARFYFSNAASAALLLAQEQIAACQGPDSTDLTFTLQGYTDNQKNTVNTYIYPSVSSLAKGGADVCADHEVTAADHLETRKDISFNN